MCKYKSPLSIVNSVGMYKVFFKANIFLLVNMTNPRDQHCEISEEIFRTQTKIASIPTEKMDFAIKMSE